jgi:Na+/phosphate symporter
VSQPIIHAHAAYLDCKLAMARQIILLRLLCTMLLCHGIDIIGGAITAKRRVLNMCFVVTLGPKCCIFTTVATATFDDVQQHQRSETAWQPAVSRVVQ